MSYVKSTVGFRTRSRRLRVRKQRTSALAVLLFTAALVWLVAHARGSAVAPQVREPAPDLAQRVVKAPPAPPWMAGDRRRLWSRLHGAFAPVIAGAAGWSLAVVSAEGTTLFDERAGRAVAPASVLKLVVAASALDALGPAYRFHTMFAARGSIGDDGRLDGDLWLVGSGDPSLISGDLRNGIGVLARSGLRRVDGRVMVDATAMTGPSLNPHWDRDDNGQDYAAPTSAVSLDGDTIESQEIVDGVGAARVDADAQRRGLRRRADQGHARGARHRERVAARRRILSAGRHRGMGPPVGTAAGARIAHAICFGQPLRRATAADDRRRGRRHAGRCRRNRGRAALLGTARRSGARAAVVRRERSVAGQSHRRNHGGAAARRQSAVAVPALAARRSRRNARGL